MNDGGFRAARASMTPGPGATKFRNRTQGPADVDGIERAASFFAATFQDPAPTIAPGLGPRDPLEELKVSPTTIEEVELQTLADGEQRRVPATVVALDQGPGEWRPRCSPWPWWVVVPRPRRTGWSASAPARREGQCASVQHLTFSAVAASADQPALPRWQRRRGTHHRQPEPLPGDRDRRERARPHGFRQRLHQCEPRARADRWFLVDEQRHLELLDGDVGYRTDAHERRHERSQR